MIYNFVITLKKKRNYILSMKTRSNLFIDIYNVEIDLHFIKIKVIYLV